MRWPLQTLQPLQKTQLQPPFGPSVDSLCHPWFTTTHLSYRCPIFETSATAFCGTTGISTVSIYIYISSLYIYIYIHNYILWPCISQQHSGHVYHNNQNLKTRRGPYQAQWFQVELLTHLQVCELVDGLLSWGAPGIWWKPEFWKVNHWKSQSILNVGLFDKCVEGW